MSPIFPHFKPIEITDQEIIENFIKDHPPYSNYSFVSLYCWDVDKRRKFSFLHGNLVFRTTSDITGKEFLTFLGTNRVPETIKELFLYAQREGIQDALRLIPEEAVQFCSDPTLHLHIQEDRDNFDYVYQVRELAELKGSKYENLRKSVNNFVKTYKESHKFKFFDLEKPNSKKEILSVWKAWQGINERYSVREEMALNRLLDHSHTLNLINTMVLVHNRPVAFSINQIAHGNCSISHFAKADYNYKGVLAFLDHETLKHLHRTGCEFMNFEEDMGLQSLRFAKNKYRPIKFLRKYTISQKYGMIKRYINYIFNRHRTT